MFMIYVNDEPLSYVSDEIEANRLVSKLTAVDPLASVLYRPMLINVTFM